MLLSSQHELIFTNNNRCLFFHNLIRFVCTLLALINEMNHNSVVFFFFHLTLFITCSPTLSLICNSIRIFFGIVGGCATLECGQSDCSWFRELHVVAPLQLQMATLKWFVLNWCRFFFLSMKIPLKMKFPEKFALGLQQYNRLLVLFNTVFFPRVRRISS